MLHEEVDVTLMRLIESFLEDAPQLTLQLYIMATHGAQSDSILGELGAVRFEHPLIRITTDWCKYDALWLTWIDPLQSANEMDCCLSKTTIRISKSNGTNDQMFRCRQFSSRLYRQPPSPKKRRMFRPILPGVALCGVWIWLGACPH